MNTDFLFNNKTTGKIGSVTLDCTLSDEHTFRNEVSEYTVESGASENEHIRKLPDKLVLTGLVTDTPLPRNLVEGVTSFVSPFTKTSESRTEQALYELLRLTGRAYPVKPGLPTTREYAPQLVTVVTGLLVYNNMVITSLNIKRDSRTGKALSFTIEFSPFNKVAYQTVLIDAPVSQTSGSIKTVVPRTKTYGSVVSTQEKQKVSILAGMFNRLATGK